MSTASFSTANTAAGRTSTGPGVLLVAAPILMAVGRLLLVPLDDADWDGVMSDMAANPGRSDAGWFLPIAACGLLAATAVILARRLADEGRGRTAMFVTVTTALGWAAAAALSHPATRRLSRPACHRPRPAVEEPGAMILPPRLSTPRRS
jgi:hypothetical protein